jgi:aldehyde dehydrogenase (NAD+)
MSEVGEILARLGASPSPRAVAIGGTYREGAGEPIVVRSPIDGAEVARFAAATAQDVDDAVRAARAAFDVFRAMPAPARGELVRRFGVLLREHASDLAALVTLEAGKIAAEAAGEVQEMIDVCDFAVGLSRQLHGKTIASERPRHRLAEQWHPLGPVGILSAFNFPVAVWSWNAALALVCGDPLVWKPSERTPLCALASHALLVRAASSLPDVPDGVSSVVIGRADVGRALAAHPGVPLVSATGSTRMGREVAQVVAARLGRSLLELGGNNGMIVAPSADLELAVRSIVFAAVGTAGQRCTSLRRLFVHDDVRDALLARLRAAYASLPIGDPRREGVLVGPLVDADAGERMEAALDRARRDGGVVHFGERVVDGVPPGGVYVRPALVEMAQQTPIVCEETFAPILYVLPYTRLEDAIRAHNDVPQGLASAIFTNDVREAELFCSAEGSDCGLVNVNIGTSGAEIGGAFGGEKDTGGGRESGSDAWKAYMRRATNTINYSRALPLAQGIRFDVPS